jgi:hypothetical protein
MAFGIKKAELEEWKRQIENGQIAFLTHYWLDDRFPESRTVTKVGCSDFNKLIKWGKQYGLKKEWIHIRKDGYSHFDLLGDTQSKILELEGIKINL